MLDERKNKRVVVVVRRDGISGLWDPEREKKKERERDGAEGILFVSKTRRGESKFCGLGSPFLFFFFLCVGHPLHQQVVLPVGGNGKGSWQPSSSSTIAPEEAKKTLKNQRKTYT